MNKAVKIGIVIVLLVLVSLVVAIKRQQRHSSFESAFAANTDSRTPAVSQTENPNESSAAEKASQLPLLLDLGADKCIPCKMMKPILEELKQVYKEQFQVTFIDVWENPDQARKYNIRMIPTQIFFDAEGKELFRHEGFYSKEDILNKWKELGIEIEKGKKE